MSNSNEASEFATFYRIYKQLTENQRLEGIQPQPATGLQQRPQYQRLSLARNRPQPYRQPAGRNTPELSAVVQIVEELRKRQDEIFTVLENLMNMSEQIKATVDDNMARMHDIIKRFEVTGRTVIEMALHSSNPQPSNGSSSQTQISPNPPAHGQHASQQQNSSTLSKPYSQESNVTQPPTFVPSSNSSQLLYTQAPGQAPETYSDQNYLDYSALDFLANNTS